LIVGEFYSVGIGEGLTARSSYSFPDKEEIFGRLFWVRSFQTRVILCCNYSRFYFEKFSPQVSLYVCYSWMVSLKGNSMCDTIVLFLPIDCERKSQPSPSDRLLLLVCPISTVCKQLPSVTYSCHCSCALNHSSSPASVTT